MNDDTTAGGPHRDGNDDETRQMPVSPRSPWESPGGSRDGRADETAEHAASATSASHGAPPPPAGAYGTGNAGSPPPAPSSGSRSPGDARNGRAGEPSDAAYAAPGPEQSGPAGGGQEHGSHAAAYGAPHPAQDDRHQGRADSWQQAGPRQGWQQQGWPQGGPGAYPQQAGGWQQAPAGQAAWGGHAGRPAAQRPGFLKALFDLSFRHSVTLGFAKVIYVLAIVVAVGAWLIALFTAMAGLNDPWVGPAAAGGLLATIVLGIPLMLLWIVLVRVGLEVTVATVRTADNTARLVELGEDRAGAR